MMIENPKTTQNVYIPPSGYLHEVKDEDGDSKIFLYDKVTLREMTGHEEDLLANKKLSMVDKFHRILGACIVQLECSETGEVITDKRLLVQTVNKMLMSDIVVLLMRLRQVSLGDRVVMKPRCPDGECREILKKTLDLSQLEVIPTVGDKKERVRDFETKNGNTIQWEMVDGFTEKSFKAKAEKKGRKGKDVLTSALLMRVKTVNNEPAKMEVLKNMSISERNEIRDHFDEEGGIETEVDVTCTACGLEFTVQMEVTAADFFAPSKESDLEMSES